MSLRVRWHAAATSIAVLVLSVAVAGAPAAAQTTGGTIVYVADGNVWITTPDGSQRHQVTTDGTPDDPWESPSMDDSGVILAARGTGRAGDAQLVRLSQSGQVLSAFQPSVVFDAGFYHVEVAADGELAAYSTLEPCYDSEGNLRVCSSLDIVYADGRSPNSLGGTVLEEELTWYPGHDIVATGSFDYVEPGDQEEKEWFLTEMDASDLAIARDGSYLAASGCDYNTGSDDPFDFGCVPGIAFYQLNGAPPAAGSQLDCRITPDSADTAFTEVSLAPGGDAVVYAYSPDGSYDAATSVIEIAYGFSPDPCSADGFTPLAEGATAPFWSPAAFDPTGPGQPSDPGGEPDAVQRLDGGGSADPVAQAIATSRALFADGAADRVVLATADRFPDALAGAPLAGDRGPILLTPFADTLDPRVAEEIQRVTGGSAVVLTLGGAGAVSDGAAAQARAAAGDEPCSAPLPTSCRYAGSGREATAALIAETVLAEHPGTTRALLARGDVFADAITGGAFAAAAGVPILLTPPNSLNGSTSAFVADHGLHEVIVLGGQAAVSQAAMDAVPAPSRLRIAGSERTATAAAIATELWLPAGLARGGIVLINARHDNGWQTALAGAVASALLGAPQLAVENPPTTPGEATLTAAARLSGPVLALGGPELVSDQQAQAVATAAG